MKDEEPKPAQDYPTPDTFTSGCIPDKKQPTQEWTITIVDDLLDYRRRNSHAVAAAHNAALAAEREKNDTLRHETYDLNDQLAAEREEMKHWQEVYDLAIHREDDLRSQLDAEQEAVAECNQYVAQAKSQLAAEREKTALATQMVHIESKRANEAEKQLAAEREAHDKTAKQFVDMKAYTDATEIKREQAEKLYRLAEDNQIKWMKNCATLEKQLADEKEEHGRITANLAMQVQEVTHKLTAERKDRDEWRASAAGYGADAEQAKNDLVETTADLQDAMSRVEQLRDQLAVLVDALKELNTHRQSTECYHIIDAALAGAKEKDATLEGKLNRPSLIDQTGLP